LANGLIVDKAFRSYIRSLIREHGIGLEEEVYCVVETGKDYELPSDEYALIRGPEIMLTCSIRGVKGQVFTVSPHGFKGTVSKVLEMDLGSYSGRSIFYAFSNALLRLLGYVDKTLHCRGDEPIKCGFKLYEKLARDNGIVLHIGYQPGHVMVLSHYLRDNLLVTDLRSDTIWCVKHGRLVYDGVYNDIYLSMADTILVTASSVVNKTFWDIVSKAYMLKKKIIVYGVSAPALIYFINKYMGLKLDSFCPYAR